MKSARLVLPNDAARTRLRDLVTAVNEDIDGLAGKPTGGASAETTGLAASWAKLVEHLALGPEPAARRCPACDRVGSRAALICGYCWTKLTPLAATEPTSH